MNPSPILEMKPPKIQAKHIRLLEKLSNASGVSGDEGEIRKIVLEAIRPHVDELQVDVLGNVLAIKRGKGRNLPRVMLAAHMDEVGFMISADNDKGFYSFAIVGGIDPRYLPGKRVIVGKDHLPGVIGAKPIHHTTPDERKSSISINSLKIDLGPDNAKKAVVGTYACFDTKFQKIGSSLRGKALDDRLGVATLITLLENATDNIDLMAAFTVQEEVGGNGARVAAYHFNPDLAIVLECTPSLDMPVWDGKENTEYRSKIGAGPALYVSDSATLSDPRLIKHFRTVAETYSIPYQLRQPGLGGTDAGQIHKQREGIPSMSISAPARYLHTPASVIRLSDWKNYLALIYNSLCHINKDFLKGERRSVK